jgi:hypothetical protein
METVDGGAEPEQKAKAKPVPWTQAEIQTLQRAIGVHGTRWTLIKQDPEFKHVLWRPIKSLAVSTFAKDAPRACILTVLLFYMLFFNYQLSNLSMYIQNGCVELSSKHLGLSSMGC